MTSIRGVVFFFSGGNWIPAPPVTTWAPVPKEDTHAMLWPLAELFLLSLQPVARVESERSLATMPHLNWWSSQMSWVGRNLSHQERSKNSVQCHSVPWCRRSSGAWWLQGSARGQGSVTVTSVWSKCHFIFLSLTGLLLFLCLKMLPAVNSLPIQNS